MEVRPCDGPVERGDLLVAAETRRDGYFTVRQARQGETPLAVALTNAHALGFVALTREGA